MDYSKSKFENALAERLYELSLDGGQDDSIGSVDELGWAGRFNDERAVLTEDSQGFVWVEQHETDLTFEEHWQDILDLYEEFDYGLVV